MHKEGPLIIAGPCSAESYEQLCETATAIATIAQVSMLRCGVWKPRTRPGGFEGRGEEALRWIATLKREHPEWRFCCEVASADHVELALSYAIDALWIGARTTTDPFAVGEIAEALRGSGTTVMVKNSPMPSVATWIGAIERVEHATGGRVIAVHRGFATYSTSTLRNSPLWDIPIELRRQRPDIAIICDPSHIAGRSDRVGEVASTALLMGFDGLMIEVHSDPEHALTDAAQQLTPAMLRTLLSHLPQRNNDEACAEQRLADMRSAIDEIDHQLLSLLAQRMLLSQRIGKVKQQYAMPVLQSSRWQTLLADRLATAAQIGLDETFVKEIYEKIHSESIRTQVEQASHASDEVGDATV